MTGEHTESVLVRVIGAAGRLTLNRPAVLNVLDLTMVRLFRSALDAWRADESVRLVVIDGAGQRAFCAGGDVRMLRTAILGGQLGVVTDFLREEYALNAVIADYPKPVIVITDGLTMGGGVGLACHARLRVVTERTAIAMPEARIGFTPDVGGSLLLARAPGRLGEYLALTGLDLGPGDAVRSGLADVVTASSNVGDLVAEMEAGADPSEVLKVAAVETADAPTRLLGESEWIDDAFSGSDVPEIIDRLRKVEQPLAREALQAMQAGSPTSLVVALSSVRRAREVDDLREMLRLEYGLALWFASTRTDMPEGIRSRLVDRDGQPRWRPAEIRDVTPDLVDEAWAFEPEEPLWAH